jgi:hypothetical protein
MHFILSEPSVIAISGSPPPLTLLIYLTSLTFAHHSQLEFFSFDSNSFPLRGNHFLWQELISFDR